MDPLLPRVTPFADVLHVTPIDCHVLRVTSFADFQLFLKKQSVTDPISTLDLYIISKKAILCVVLCVCLIENLRILLFYTYKISIFILKQKKETKNLKSRYCPLWKRQNQIATHECYATMFAIALTMRAINNYVLTNTLKFEIERYACQTEYFWDTDYQTYWLVQH
ncbi:hypothetical protein Hanom_Chr12g01097921 [Helianthus anomalus]